MKELVRIYPNIKQKYILTRVIQDGNELVLLWGNPNIKWHKDILQEMKDKGIEVIGPLGGGWLFFDSEMDVVYVWGKSDGLGPAPIRLVFELLGGKVLEKEPV